MFVMSKRKFTTTLDSDLIKQLKVYAVVHDTSVATLLEEMATKYLAETTASK